MLVKTTPVHVPADRTQRKRVTNKSGGALYYGPTSAVSVASNDGSLEPSESVVLTTGTYFVSASQTDVDVSWLSDLTGQDLATQAELEELRINVASFGSVAEDATATFKSAFKTLAGTGATLWVPEGVYELTASPGDVNGFTLEGEGVYDWEGVTGQGTVLSLEGALKTTATDLFVIKNGGAVKGCVFYYPGEDVEAAEPKITATGYCVKLAGTATRGGVCEGNYFVNVPYAIKNTNGWSRIVGNWICATREAICDEQGLTEHHITGNSISFGIWFASIGKPIRDWIAQNAIAFRGIDTAAQCSDNNVYGCKVGVQLEGEFLFFTWANSVLDGCRYQLLQLAGAGPGNAIISSVNGGSLVAAGSGSTNEFMTIESAGVKVEAPAGDARYTLANCALDGANGHVIQVVNAAGAGKVDMVISGGHLDNPGRFAHSHTLTITNAVGTFQNGDTITGGTSEETAFVLKQDGSTLYIDDVTGTFTAEETITGSVSKATAKVGTLTANATYRAIDFEDGKGGNLLVTGVKSRWQNYPLPAGIRVRKAGTANIAGNHFEGAGANSAACIKVDACDTLIERGNSSDVAGSNADYEYGTITTKRLDPASAWSRTKARLLIAEDGKVEWAAAGEAADTNLYRDAANRLKTDDEFRSGSDIIARVGLGTQVKLGFDGTTAGISFGSAGTDILRRMEADVVGTPNSFRITKDLDHDGTKAGFFGTAPTTKPTALTAANAETVDNTYGEPEAKTITNLRTRVNELEEKLKSLGLLA